MRRLAARGCSSTSWPQIRALPLVGVRKPVIIFIVVDLPAAFGPLASRTDGRGGILAGVPSPSPAALQRLQRADPALAAALRRVGPYPGFPQAARARRETHYEALARAIVFQQLAGKAAATIH